MLCDGLLRSPSWASRPVNAGGLLLKRQHPFKGRLDLLTPSRRRSRFRRTKILALQRPSALPAEDARMVPGPKPAPARPSHRQAVFIRVNEATKWAVTAIVTIVLLWRHDVHSMWSVVGCVASSFICKVLKQLINQQRPMGARKTDGGMPSSHANNLGFLSTYMATACWHGLPGHADPSKTFGIASGVMAAAVFLAYLRIATGYHTAAQVIVGFCLGAASSIVWHQLGLVSVLDPSQHHLIVYLQLVTGAAAVIWVLVNMRLWFKETRSANG